MNESWKCLPSNASSAGVSAVLRARGGFRAAYQALPRSLVAKLEALDGGRQSANCSRSDFFSKPAAQRAVVLHYGRSIGVSNIFRLSFGNESVAIPG
jgi:hypothetical protein